MAKKESKNDKLERFKKTQELMEILKRGSIEDQALLYSTSETLPSEEKHASDLLDNAESLGEQRTAKRPVSIKRKGNATAAKRNIAAARHAVHKPSKKHVSVKKSGGKKNKQKQGAKARRR